MNSAKSVLYRVADLSLDPGQRRLWRDSEEIELPKRSFDLLMALVEASPNSLSTDELIEKVWNGAVVSPATVAKRVELLRHALGDQSEDSRYIALVRGHGYRLVPTIGNESESVPSPFPRWIAVASVILVFVIAWIGIEFERPAPEKSMAVLPFVSLTGDAEDERFADGLTEELIHALTSRGDIKVTGRTSSFYYKGQREDLRQIGSALGVANILEGSVRRDSETIRVTAQLVDASDGFQLWSEVYDRPSTDVLKIQQDIARSVSERLQSSPTQSRTIARSRTSTDPDAYAMYLKAVSLSPYPFGTDLVTAQALLEEAVELDPDFAAAWARLAVVHGRRIVARDPAYPLSPQEGLDIVQRALDKARELDPELGEVYAALGGIAWAIERNPVKAAPLVEKALTLDPWNLSIIAFAANFATYIGRYEEAVALEERLIARDPLCETCRYQLARSYEFTRQFDLMERELLTLNTLGERNVQGELALAKLYQGMPDEALQTIPNDDEPQLWSQLVRAMALHDLEDRELSAKLLAGAVEKWGANSPLDLAQAYAYTGDVENAFLWLQNAITSDPQSLYFQFPSPIFDNLRDDPRWNAFLKPLGLAPEQLAAVPFSLRTVLND